MCVIFAILICFFTQGVYSGMCPSMCFCEKYLENPYQTNSFYYTCTSCETYETNLIAELDNTTKILKISNFSANDLSSFIPKLSFNVSNIPYLNELSIKNSEISEYNRNNNNISVNKIRGLHFLHLSNNKLTSIPNRLLNLSSNLKTLDLSNNEITMFDHQRALSPFRTLRTLEVLNLSTNSLSSVAANSFDGLTNLKCLDLSRNNLTILDNKVFVPLATLQYLNLSNNKLEVLSEVNFISLVRLQHLDVSWNRLERVAPGSLQLPSLARLLLAGNPQLGVSRNSGILVGNGRRLQTVDASRTGLKQVPAALTHSIRTLRLAGNSILRVNCGDLDSYPLLQLLDFTANQLEVVEDDALGRLDCLSIIYLTDNKIKEIPRSLPEKLKVLHLEHNHIRRISKDDLQGVTSLEVLLLNDNNISIVEEGAFSQLVDLVTLDLSRNPVIELQPDCLMGPLALHVLRLASIAAISPAEEVSFPLSNIEHLITLDLSGSSGLAKQLMADTAALAAALELQELDLSHTGLEFIRSDLLHYLPQLRVLHIKENRLNCSGLEWLAEWIRRQDDLEYRTIQCASPAELWGTLLIDLQTTNSVDLTSKTQLNDAKKSIIFNNSINVNINKKSMHLHQYSSSKIKNNKLKNIKSSKNNNAGDALIIKNNLKENEKSFFHKDSLLYNFSTAYNVTNKLNANVNYSFDYSSILLPNKKVKLNVPKNKSPETTTNYFVSSPTILSPKTLPNVSASVQTSLTSKLVEDVANSQATQTTRSLGKLNKFIQITNSDSKAFSSNELSNNLGKLFIAPTEYTKRNNRLKEFAGPAALTAKAVVASAVAIDEKMTVNSSHWNITTLEMSMFTNSDHNTAGFLHPGIFILTAGILGAGATLAMLAAKFTRMKRRRDSRLFEENIEVTNLSNVTELW